MRVFQRFEMDGAFRDRFPIFIDWPIDEQLEKSLVPPEEIYQAWHKTVIRARLAVKNHGIKKHEVTPRATFAGCALLAQGIDRETVINSCLRKGLPDETCKTISDAL